MLHKTEYLVDCFKKIFGSLGTTQPERMKLHLLIQTPTEMTENWVFQNKKESVYIVHTRNVKGFLLGMM